MVKDLQVVKFKAFSMVIESFIKKENYLAIPFSHEYFVSAEEGLLIITEHSLNANIYMGPSLVTLTGNDLTFLKMPVYLPEP